MILTFVNAGTSNASSVINYLFSENDSNGKPRNPPAELLEGDIEVTRFLIDSNSHKKFKYTSLAISFRDNEKPTDKELRDIMDSFRETFCPNLGPEKVSMLIVKHQDKSNTELHIVVPNVCIVGNRLKSFNICPPGKHNQQLQKDFSSYWNHKLDYEQVVGNPFKAAFSRFDAKTDEGGAGKERKERLSSICAERIMSGKVNNRKELIDFLSQKGCSITRKGKDYLSIKLPGKDKAIRFRGGCFVEDADYRVLIAKHNSASKTLTPVKLRQVIERMDKTTEYRKAFNEKTYTPKVRMQTIRTQKPKEIRILPKMKSRGSTVVESKAAEQRTTKVSSNQVQQSKPNFSKFKALGKSSQSATPVSSGGGALSSYGNIESQIVALGAKLSQVPPEQRPAIEKQIAMLRAQLIRMAYQIQDQKRRELNRNNKL